MKKHLLILLASLLLGLCARAADDDQFTVDGLKYTVISEAAKTVSVRKGETKPTGALIIPAQVTNNSTTYSVTEIGGWAFYECTGLTSVTIPNSVTTFGDRAFLICSGLTSVNIPNSVTSIGDEVFAGCSSLTSLAIPNSVTSIGSFAFKDCTGLTSVAIPNSVTSIVPGAFYGCSGLTSINIPNSVTTIESEAFYGCSGLTSITIPNSVTSIGYSAFNGCCTLQSFIVEQNNPKFLSVDGVLFNKDKSTIICYPGGKGKNYTIPNSVTTIGNMAFYECSGLTSVTIPNSVTSIGDKAFFKCSGLTSVSIPNSVTSIGGSAFFECSGLTSVTIPNSVTSIGGSAFFGCTGLTSVSIPNSVTIIGNYVFNGCSGLTYVSIPNSVTTIGGGAFWGCSALTSITIPSSVTEISNTAFWYCRLLKCFTVAPNNPNYSSIDGVLLNKDKSTIICYPADKGKNYTIPNSVTTIGYTAFSGCSGLTSVTIPNSVTSIGESAFSGCSGLTSVSIPNSVTSIGKSVFGGCSGLMSVTIGNSVTEIGKGAFYGCEGITSIIIPNSVVSIDDEVFTNCSGLTSLTIGNSVTSIGIKAFSGCTGLTSITIPNSVTSIGFRAFSGCTGLTSVTIMDGNNTVNQDLSSIICSINSDCPIEQIKAADGSKLFTSIDGVLYNKSKTMVIWYPARKSNEYNIPISVTEIGKSAFYGCSGLTSLTIPNAATLIGKSAFYGCSGLTSFTIPNAVTSIGDRAFSGCSGLTSVTIGNSVSEIGKYAFYGCGGLTSLTIPNAVTSIGNDAFRSCSGLTSVNIPNSVTEIGDYAFKQCSSLKEIFVFAETPPAIDSRTFSEIAPGAKFYVPAESSSQYKYDWGSGYNILKLEDLENFVLGDLRYTFYSREGNKAATLRGYVNEPSGELFIPEHIFGLYPVTKISNSALSNCSNLTSVTFPKSVTWISHSAFADCSNLTSVTFEGNIPYIEDDEIYDGDVFIVYLSAFHNCPILTTLNFGKYTSEIPSHKIVRLAKLPITHLTVNEENPNLSSKDGVVFNKSQSELIYYPTCKSGSYNMPGTVTHVGTNAFYNCSGLTSITIPGSVSSIGQSAFDGCGSLRTIYSLASTPARVGTDGFSGVPKDAVVYIPKGSLVRYYNVLSDGWSQFYDYREMGALDVTLSATNLQLRIGKKATLTAKVMKDAEVSIVSEEWTSSDATVVTVSGGTLRATGPGKATVTYMVVDNYGCAHSAECAVEVEGDSGIDEVEGEVNAAPVEYYRLNGQRVSAERLSPGMYIRRQGRETMKIVVR